MMRFYTICTLLWAMCLNSVYSRSIADSLLQKGSYYEASVEYERQAFIAESNVMRTQALLQKSACLRELQKFSEAAQCLERVNLEDLPDSLTFNVQYYTSLYQYICGEFGAAESHLLQLNQDVKDSTLLLSSYYLYALVLNERQKWEEAKHTLEKLIRMSNLPVAQQDSFSLLFKNIYQTKNYPRLKRIAKAQILSSILPGSGQMYIGYYGEGITNALLTLASVGYIGYNVWIRQYITALTIPSGIFQKFYFGGVNRVVFLANKKNHALLRHFNDPLKEKILSLEQARIKGHL